MPRIQSVATAVPATCIDQELASEFARRMFTGRIPDLERLLPLFTNAGIRTRYFAVPQEWFFTDHDLAEKSAISAREATRLSAEAAGLSHAYHYALAHPGARILVIATELCGLTFLSGDTSKSNLVAIALFGDGASAAVVTDDECEGPGLEVLGTRSRFYPDSLDVMGWTVLQEGLQVVFAQRIPQIVEETAAEDVGTFLADHGLKIADIDAFLLHPGGTKVLEAYEKALVLEPAQLALARGVLRDFGNMSSATVFFVLERYLDEHGTGQGGHGLISALGPGFCSESLLVGL